MGFESPRGRDWTLCAYDSHVRNFWTSGIMPEGPKLVKRRQRTRAWAEPQPVRVFAISLSICLSLVHSKHFSHDIGFFGLLADPATSTVDAEINRFNAARTVGPLQAQDEQRLLLVTLVGTLWAPRNAQRLCI